MRRELDVDARIGWPATRGDDVDAHLDAIGKFFVNLGGLPEVCHDFSAEFDILKHAFEVLGKLTPAFSLEFTNHALLGVNAGALAVQQALGELLLVKAFKHIFTDDVPKQRQRFV